VTADLAAPADLETAQDLYRQMAVIRAFERQAYRAYERGQVHGTVHASIGQEAVAVGVVGVLGESDTVLSHHRGHGHALAKGVDPGRLMAELCGRADGVSRGKGGSMHATDVGHGFLGTMAVVGSAVPLAVGVALANKVRGNDSVCVAFFGDGAVNQGVLYESLNLAALWALPVVFVCENNAYAITTSAEESTAGEGIIARARAFGVTAERVDGQDVHAVNAEASRLVEGARQGRPAVLEALTYRFMGHSRGDPPHGVYRTKDELGEWTKRDPLTVLATATGLDDAVVAQLEAEAADVAEAAMAFALASPEPGVEDLMDGIRR
jgi:TPP-dependent pyruvate/acetoin dehydrogenase alpha subunit